MIVSSRSGLVESSATGAPINSSTRRTYLMALAGSAAQDREDCLDYHGGYPGGAGAEYFFG